MRKQRGVKRLHHSGLGLADARTLRLHRRTRDARQTGAGLPAESQDRLVGDLADQRQAQARESRHESDGQRARVLAFENKRVLGSEAAASSMDLRPMVQRVERRDVARSTPPEVCDLVEDSHPE